MPYPFVAYDLRAEAPVVGARIWPPCSYFVFTPLENDDQVSLVYFQRETYAYHYCFLGSLSVICRLILPVFCVEASLGKRPWVLG